MNNLGFCQVTNGPKTWGQVITYEGGSLIQPAHNRIHDEKAQSAEGSMLSPKSLRFDILLTIKQNGAVPSRGGL